MKSRANRPTNLQHNTRVIFYNTDTQSVHICEQHFVRWTCFESKRLSKRIYKATIKRSTKIECWMPNHIYSHNHRDTVVCRFVRKLLALHHRNNINIYYFYDLHALLQKCYKLQLKHCKFAYLYMTTFAQTVQRKCHVIAVIWPICPRRSMF